ncbi:MAG: radical SAM family heme chaperone HemW [Bacilli bacterium]|nr:radical SAM family heme chaperone HemW [Bacilli bacterium]
MIKNCYIHIPFCNKICSYCDFCKLYYDEKFVNRYLNELEKEIKSIYKGEVLDTIYIGGGTPSSLNNKQLERLFEILKLFNKSETVEFTIESNFENINEEKLLIYKKNGINRLSFGLESINENNLTFLNRNIAKERINNTINSCRSLGFNNINIDLIYALPVEDISILKNDLDYIFSLDIEHISTYSLMIEDHTMLKINNIENISEELDYEMYKLICKEMKKNNYYHYEISNFSKSGYESKHNLCYWNNDNYYGFGLGASSYIDNKRITNTRSINKYLKGNYRLDIIELSNNDLIEYKIMLNLRKAEGISLKEVKLDVRDLVKEGLLKEENNRVRIPEEKWYVSNEIILRVLEDYNE